jgi:O-antigen/teichoic acid export membrane protein
MGCNYLIQKFDFKILKVKLFLSKLRNHHTFKNVGYLTLANVLSQLISLVGAFYIPKLLGPAYYGIYNSVIAYVALFGVFTFSGLTKVIIRESAKDTSKAQEILESTIGLRSLCSLLAATLSIVVVLFVDYELGTKFYIAVYSFSLLIQGTQDSINTVFISHQKMKILGVVAIAKQLLRVPMSILLLHLGYGVLSLIILHLILEVSTTIYFYRASQRIIGFKFFSKIQISKEYLYSGGRFSLLNFFNVLSGKADLVMLSFLTTPTNVGIYALAYRLVEKGLMLRVPISLSLFPYYSAKFENKKPHIKELLTHTALISIPLVIFLVPTIFLIEPLILSVIGQEFIASADIFKVLVFYLVFNFSVIPWGLSLQTTSNEKYSLITVSVCAIANIFLNFVLFSKYGIIGIAYATLLVEIIRLSITIFLVKIKIL